MKLKLNDPLVKLSIWEVYSRKCYYSDMPIKLAEMELDHVIPKHLLNNPLELEAVLDKFHLPKDYDILNIENVVPCTRNENKRKGTEILPHTPSILIDINRKLKSVKSIHNKILKEGNIEKYKSFLKSGVESGDAEIEEVHYFLRDEKPVYQVSESYNDDFHHAHYCRSTKRIFLNGFLPKPSSEVSSCCVSFKSLEIRGLMFTLTEEDVFELTDPKHKEETLRIQPNAEHYPNLKGTAFFKFKGVNFFLDINEIHEFYDVLSTYRKKIEIHKSLLNKFLGIEKFALSRAGDNYRLGKIKRGLWVLMLKFAKEYDFDRGDSEWHIFDAKHNMLLVSSGRDCSKYNLGFHTMFLPEQVERDNFQDFRHVDDEIWILWNKMMPNAGGGNFTSYSIKDRWNAKMSFQWLTKEFIPYVIWYYKVSKKDKLFKYVSYNRFQFQFDVGHYIWN